MAIESFSAVVRSRQITDEIILIGCCRGSDLFLVVQTLDHPGLLPGFVQRRQQHSRQNRDDRDHDEELYQRKTAFSLER